MQNGDHYFVPLQLHNFFSYQGIKYPREETESLFNLPTYCMHQGIWNAVESRALIISYHFTFKTSVAIKELNIQQKSENARRYSF
jgi:hypothetical protein